MITVIVILFGVAIIMLTPILLHDIFGVRFYKKETDINMHDWLRNNICEIKKRISSMRSKIKGDYIVAFIVFLFFLSAAAYFITNGNTADIPEIWQWIIVSILGAITLYIIGRLSGVKKLNYPKFKTVKSFKRRFGWKWIWIPMLVAGVGFIGIKVYKRYQIAQATKELSTNTGIPLANNTPNYPQMMPEEKNTFQAGQLTKGFRLKNFGDSYYPVPVGRNDNDTVTLSFSGPSGSWKYKTWIQNGKIGYEEVVGQSAFVAGSHTIQVDKPSTILWTTKAPPSL